MKNAATQFASDVITVFPSPKGGGPIEDTQEGEMPRLETMFPSPKGGGPIEEAFRS